MYRPIFRLTEVGEISDSAFMSGPVMFINIVGKEEATKSKSLVNMKEVNVMEHIVNDLAGRKVDLALDKV